MAKIKHTKNELKTQREGLTRYERFLPMLQLKKQQLQAEMISISHQIEQNTVELERFSAGLQPWLDLFAEPADVGSLVAVREIRTDEHNIAGVNMPVFEEVIFDRKELDLFATPPWFDAAIDAIEQLVRFRIKTRILEQQRQLIREELRITTQRVNLFEKVKIPECRENIRIIKIFLGDEQTAGVVRAKIAKSRTLEYEHQAVAATA